MEAHIESITYVTRLEEVVWGLLLIAFSLAIHGFGMVLTLQATRSFKERLAAHGRLLSGIVPIILGTWLILLVMVAEVVMWAGFFQWKHCFENLSTAVYFTGLQYTTVGSSLNLPAKWRLHEIMVASAGLMGFAWSTGVLMALAQDFQTEQLQALRSLRILGARKKHPAASKPPHPGVRE